VKSLLKSLLPLAVIVPLQNRRDREKLRLALSGASAPGGWAEGVLEAARRALGNTGTGAVETRAAFREIERLRGRWARKSGAISVRDFGATHSDGALRPSGVTFDVTYREKFLFASSTRTYGSFYHHLVRGMGLHRVLELGTNVGMSGSYIASALQAETEGKLVTLEGSEAVSEVARQVFEAQGLEDRVTRIIGPFHETLAGCLTEHGPFDLVFVDGHHDGPATVEYFHTIRPHVASSGLMIFDDIRWSESMAEAWSEIQGHEDLSGALDFRQTGIVMVGDEAEQTGSSETLESA